MDIKQLRGTVGAALAEAGLTKQSLFPKGDKVWQLSRPEVVPYFSPSPYRRTWGFVYCGVLGLEIPALRTWLLKHKPGDEAGIFRGAFTGYFSTNDELLRGFMVEHGLPVPAELWAGLIVDRLAAVPFTVEELLFQYRSNRQRLGWFAHLHDRHAWDFLLAWSKDPDPALHVPKMAPDGRIA
ncbi:hypothetical protein [Sphingomonas prati]|uniref:Uncharacterized protein n=1 Tax=Sphingomonas prati TaxID=1843237 RepID=A0A7W9BQ31_9SPHN|nr:hypothetical protein [Sphingomonas prati]MBB5727945.1 hypothetical protein [Sphingomonas prati]